MKKALITGLTLAGISLVLAACGGGGGSSSSGGGGGQSPYAGTYAGYVKPSNYGGSFTFAKTIVVNENGQIIDIDGDRDYYSSCNPARPLIPVSDDGSFSWNYQVTCKGRLGLDNGVYSGSGRIENDSLTANTNESHDLVSSPAGAYPRTKEIKATLTNIP